MYKTAKTVAAITSAGKHRETLEGILPEGTRFVTDDNPDVRKLLEGFSRELVDVVVVDDAGMPYKEYSEPDLIAFPASQTGEHKTRVIFVPTSARVPGDPFMAQLVSVGVYDIVDPLTPDIAGDIRSMIDHPRSFADCTMWYDPSAAIEAAGAAGKRAKQKGRAASKPQKAGGIFGGLFSKKRRDEPEPASALESAPAAMPAVEREPEVERELPEPMPVQPTEALPAIGAQEAPQAPAANPALDLIMQAAADPAIAARLAALASPQQPASAPAAPAPAAPAVDAARLAALSAAAPEPAAPVATAPAAAPASDPAIAARLAALASPQQPAPAAPAFEPASAQALVQDNAIEARLEALSAAQEAPAQAQAPAVAAPAPASIPAPSAQEDPIASRLAAISAAPAQDAARQQAPVAVSARAAVQEPAPEPAMMPMPEPDPASMPEPEPAPEPACEPESPKACDIPAEPEQGPASPQQQASPEQPKPAPAGAPEKTEEIETEVAPMSTTQKGETSPKQQPKKSEKKVDWSNRRKTMVAVASPNDPSSASLVAFGIACWLARRANSAQRIGVMKCVDKGLARDLNSLIELGGSQQLPQNLDFDVIDSRHPDPEFVVCDCGVALPGEGAVPAARRAWREADVRVMAVPARPWEVMESRRAVAGLPGGGATPCSWIFVGGPVMQVAPIILGDAFQNAVVEGKAHSILAEVDGGWWSKKFMEYGDIIGNLVDKRAQKEYRLASERELLWGGLLAPDGSECVEAMPICSQYAAERAKHPDWMAIEGKYEDAVNNTLRQKQASILARARRKEEKAAERAAKQKAAAEAKAAKEAAANEKPAAQAGDAEKPKAQSRSRVKTKPKPKAKAKPAAAQAGAEAKAGGDA